MAKIYIQGGTTLSGEVRVSGAKNAALAIVPATLLSPYPCVIDNIPQIADIGVFCTILTELGAKLRWLGPSQLQIETAQVTEPVAKTPLVQKLRASYYLLGAFLARFGQAEVALPGGCNIGLRPIDQHIKGFEALGARVKIHHGLVKIHAEKLKGATVYLDIVSVGATINIMLAACGAEGTTVIENAAKEPEIVDLANYLNGVGYTVRGAGTDTVRIVGGEASRGVEHPVIPDRIEAGTLMVAAAASGGRVTLKGIIPTHVEPVSAKLREMGVFVEENSDSLAIFSPRELHAIDIKTLPYPGFPTDMQAQMMVAMLKADGMSLVTESIFSNRFRYVDELRRMGAHIKVEGNTAIVFGGQALTGATVHATDLRAGAALLLAGITAQGETRVDSIFHIDRGYEQIEVKLQCLGAKIIRK